MHARSDFQARLFSDRGRRPPRVSVGLAIIAAAGAAWPASAAVQSPAISPAPISPVPITSGIPPTADPEADLWHGPVPVLRLAGRPGALVGTLETGAEHCIWKRMYGPADGAIWLTSSRRPG